MSLGGEVGAGVCVCVWGGGVVPGLMSGGEGVTGTRDRTPVDRQTHK